MNRDFIISSELNIRKYFTILLILFYNIFIPITISYPIIRLFPRNFFFKRLYLLFILSNIKNVQKVYCSFDHNVLSTLVLLYFLNQYVYYVPSICPNILLSLMCPIYLPFTISTIWIDCSCIKSNL